MPFINHSSLFLDCMKVMLFIHAYKLNRLNSFAGSFTNYRLVIVRHDPLTISAATYTALTAVTASPAVTLLQQSDTVILADTGAALTSANGNGGLLATTPRPSATPDLGRGPDRRLPQRRHDHQHRPMCCCTLRGFGGLGAMRTVTGILSALLCWPWG